MPNINPSLPIVGQPDSTEEPKVLSALQAIVAAINGNIDSANITDASLTDTDLASPNNGVWRNLLAQPFNFSSAAAGSYLFTSYGNPSAASANFGVAVLRIDPADYAVAGKTAKMRILATQLCNSIVPGTSITWSLAPVAGVSGASGALSLAIGSSVGSLGASFVASTANFTSTAAIALPAAGIYFLVATFAGSQAAGSVVSGSLELQIQHV